MMSHDLVASSERAQLKSNPGRTALIALGAIALMALSVRPAHAQTVVAENKLPATASSAASPVPAVATKSAQLPAARSAEAETSLNVNPFTASGLAALSHDSPNNDSPNGETANSLTSNPAPARSGHRALALVGGIAGTAVAGLGTMMLVADSGCRNVCGVKHLGEVTLPIGAGVAALGYYYFFHHSK